MSCLKLLYILQMIDSGLPSELSENAPATGTAHTDSENPNVIVSGWQVYNNKGWVVEKYELFYDQGFSFTSPPLVKTPTV